MCVLFEVVGCGAGTQCMAFMHANGIGNCRIRLILRASVCARAPSSGGVGGAGGQCKPSRAGCIIHAD